jgi:hypothetical protein
MSAPLSLEQLAASLNDPATRATLHQLLDLHQANIGLFSILLCLSVLVCVAIFSNLSVSLDPALRVAAQSQRPAASTCSGSNTPPSLRTPLAHEHTSGLSTASPTQDSHTPPQATVNVALNEDDDADSDSDANERYNVNRAAGLDPFNRRTVQSRRREVSEFLLSEYNVRLDKPYTRWRKDRWAAVVRVTYEKFAGSFRWKPEGAALLLKTICRDNVGNRRKMLKRRQREATVTTPAQLGSGQGQTPQDVDNASQENERVPKRKSTPKKKTLLRHPNRHMHPPIANRSPSPQPGATESPLPTLPTGTTASRSSPLPSSSTGLAIPLSPQTAATGLSDGVATPITSDPEPVAPAMTMSSQPPVYPDYSIS